MTNFQEYLALKDPYLHDSGIVVVTRIIITSIISIVTSTVTSYIEGAGIAFALFSMLGVIFSARRRHR